MNVAQTRINEEQLELYRRLLRQHSLKATPQRLAVHQAMMSLKHASADMVCEWLEQHCNTHTTTTSVYNILSQMAHLGIYRHLMSANNKMFFDVNTYKHIHLYDITSHEFKDIMDDEMMASIEERLKGKRFRGYKVDSVDIQIICHPSTKRTSNKKQ